MKFTPKTNEELLSELHSHLIEAQKITQSLQIREEFLAITCKEAKKKRHGT